MGKFILGMVVGFGLCSFLVIAGVFLFFGAFSDVGSPSGAAATPQHRGILILDRTWTDQSTGSAMALVTYRNTSSRTFNQEVKIQFIAYDAAGRKLGSNERSFFVREVGPIRPGFEGTKECHVRLNGGTFSRMEAKIVEAR